MPVFNVGPNSTYPSIAAAMAAAGASDTIQLEPGYRNETATVRHNGMVITGEASSTGIVLQLANGIATVSLTGAAPIDLQDASDGNSIVGNDGANVITVTGGSDAVSGGLGHDVLIVDYRLATGAVTGDSASNFAEAGGGARLVTVNGGFEDFTVLTGSGADTITTGAGDDEIRTGEGAGTVTAGEGRNIIVGGSGADTITAGGGGNTVDGGNGENTITTGSGADLIMTGTDADTVVAGGGIDRITVKGGSDNVDAGAQADRLVVDYATAVTAVTGGVTAGDLAAGYTGHIADLSTATADFVGVESFEITTGIGNDNINTGAGADVVRTGAGVDVIATGAGNDLLNGGTGADTMTGGTGHDSYFVDNSGDRVVEGSRAGVDHVLSTISYTLTSNTLEDLTLLGSAAINGTGNSWTNKITGNSGANVLDGGTNADTLTGGKGSDTYIVDNAGDRLVELGLQGVDVVKSSVSFSLLNTSLENLTLTGSANISGTGSGWGGTMIGNSGSNSLSGLGGNDTISGGAGVDTIEGGTGRDKFLFDTGLNGTTNVDTILDFSVADDTIVLDRSVFTAISANGTLSASAFHTGTNAADAGDRIIYDKANGNVYYDADGTGAAAKVLFATVDNNLPLSNADFIAVA